MISKLMVVVESISQKVLVEDNNTELDDERSVADSVKVVEKGLNDFIYGLWRAFVENFGKI